MSNLGDHDLDHLLVTLSRPEPAPDLTERIMNRLPLRAVGWKAQLAELFGLDRPAAPLGGALACLIAGLLLGYSPITNVALPSLDEEIRVADIFGSDPLSLSLEEPIE